jgi:Uma2 family endonuclease
MANMLHLHTSADLKNWPEDCELIEGEIVKPMSPSLYHSKIQRYFLQQLDKIDPQGKLGLMLQEPSVEFNPQNTPRPDLAFWMVNNLPQIDLEFEITKTIPDLVVEVLSPRDLEGVKHYQETMGKIRLYQAGGVKIVWVINPMHKECEVYVPGQLSALETLGIGQELDGLAVIPGFRVQIKDLFQ